MMTKKRVDQGVGVTESVAKQRNLGQPPPRLSSDNANDRGFDHSCDLLLPTTSEWVPWNPYWKTVRVQE